ncbi:CBS domain-containing protein [Halopiger thermotolerans]
MRRFTLTRVLGIPIKLDLTLLVALAIITFEIGTQLERLTSVLNRILGLGIDGTALSAGLQPWILGLIAGVGLFVGVALHELGHSLVARWYGYEIDSITLWIFGGVANFVQIPERWTHEAAIAVAGPMVSVFLGALSYGTLVAVPTSVDAAQFVLGYLAILNVTLAVFNLLPGFPMDGGRVLRALLARTRPFAKATRIAARVGQGVAVLLGLLGIVTLNIITLGIAFFLFIGAAAEARQVELQAALEDVPVRDIMTPARNLETVPPDTTVDALVNRMLRERHGGYPVVDNGRLVGIVTLDDVRDLSPEERKTRTVADVMTTDLTTVPETADASTVFEAMQSNEIGRVVVTDDRGQLVGLVSRSDLMRAFELLQWRQRTEKLTGREIPIS